MDVGNPSIARARTAKVFDLVDVFDAAFAATGTDDPEQRYRLICDLTATPAALALAVALANERRRAEGRHPMSDPSEATVAVLVSHYEHAARRAATGADPFAGLAS